MIINSKLFNKLKRVITNNHPHLLAALIVAPLIAFTYAVVCLFLNHLFPSLAGSEYTNPYFGTVLASVMLFGMNGLDIKYGEKKGLQMLIKVLFAITSFFGIIVSYAALMSY